MIKTKRTRRTTVPSRKGSAQASKERWSGKPITEERWDRFIADAKKEVAKRSDEHTAYFAEYAIWKRAVYRFTLANIENTSSAYSLSKFTEYLIYNRTDRRLPRSPTFDANPFHWVFSALSADRALMIDRRQVFRFGRHLTYARQHHVPEEFLIGFLHQAGSPSEVVRKAGMGITEPWRDQWIDAARRPIIMG